MDQLEIPIIDLSNDHTTENAAKQLFQALTSFGCVYLKGHGISQELIDEVFAASQSFFDLPSSLKEKYQRQPNGTGWYGMENERSDPSAKDADLKEAFNVFHTEGNDSENIWPDEVPKLRMVTSELMKGCWQLVLYILKAISKGLHKEDNLFETSHHLSGCCLRMLHYPALSATSKMDQLRCGEHTDFGSMTLLFQDEIGGLQICTPDGKWLDVTPVPGDIIVIISDMMQWMSSDRLQATRHRVVMPVKEYDRRKPRRSMVLFVDPDGDHIVQCLDGSDKYPPVAFRQHQASRFAGTLVKQHD